MNSHPNDNPDSDDHAPTSLPVASTTPLPLRAYLRTLTEVTQDRSRSVDPDVREFFWSTRVSTVFPENPGEHIILITTPIGPTQDMTPDRALLIIDLLTCYIKIRPIVSTHTPTLFAAVDEHLQMLHANNTPPKAVHLQEIDLLALSMHTELASQHNFAFVFNIQRDYVNYVAKTVLESMLCSIQTLRSSPMISSTVDLCASAERAWNLSSNTLRMKQAMVSTLLATASRLDPESDEWSSMQALLYGQGPNIGSGMQENDL